MEVAETEPDLATLIDGVLEKFEVERSGEALVVTDNNTPVLQVVPVESEQTITDTFAGLTGQVTYGRPVDEPTST